MKKIKVLAINIILIILLNVIIPTTFAISENLNYMNDEQKTEEFSFSESERKNDLENNKKENITVEDEKKEKTNEIENNQTKSNKDVEKEEQEQVTNVKEQQKEVSVLSENASFSAHIDVKGYKISSYLSKGIYYLFVPQSIEINELEIIYEYSTDIKQVSSGIIDNENKKITNNFSINDTLNIVANDDTKYTIKVMKSDIPSMCINLDNNISLQTVHAGSKDIKYKASMQIIGASNSSYDISDDAIEFKGRGNSTWKMDKRGYQIKLNKKQNLLGIGNGKSKKWVLLANQADRTLLRNKIAYDLGVDSGVTDIPNSTFIDLYINGEYIGNYLLSDKVETGSSRVNLQNEKGVLVEIDNEYGKQEDFYFTTQKSKTVFALKESYAGDNKLGDDAQKAALSSFENSMNKLETKLSNKSPWNEIKQLVDVESFARLYLVMELSEDPDGLYSSTYFYKDGDSDVIHAGPVWDFDAAFGYYKSTHRGGNANVDYILNYKTNTFYTQLFQYNQFVDIVNKIYTNELKAKFHNIGSKINEYKNIMSNSIKMNFIRWDYLLGNTFENPSTTPNGTTYQSEVDYLEKWILKRVSYMDQRYSISTVEYKGHIQDYGWDNFKKDGQVTGTTGQSKRIEAIRIILPTENPDIHIKYQTHVQDIGWQSWTQDGELSGTEGKAKRVEGIRIKLEGMPNYSVMYRVHVENIGWQEWKYDGQMAGTEGQCLRIEAVEIKVLETKYLGSKEQTIDSKINYMAHIQNIGWSGWGKNNEVIGTQNMSYRLEGIKISLNNTAIPNTNIIYKVHIQDYGWQGWKSNGEMAGTSGESKRLEAIMIKLDNPKYMIRYRTYIQNKGWRTMG